jgi:hypothetical protein
MPEDKHIEDRTNLFFFALRQASRLERCRRCAQKSEVSGEGQFLKFGNL